MKLSKDDVGKEFNREDGEIATMVSYHKYESLFSLSDGSVHLNENLNGYSNENPAMAIASRHDPRTWLAEMPDLGDIKDGWITCSDDGNWCVSSYSPELVGSMWTSEGRAVLSDLFNMPTLTGDQWKQSKISIAELKQWQAENKGE